MMHIDFMEFRYFNLSGQLFEMDRGVGKYQGQTPQLLLTG
jgi:hypothetical protein